VNNLAEIRKREGDCRIQGVKWITAETKSSRLLLAMLALLRNQTMKLAKVGIHPSTCDGRGRGEVRAQISISAPARLRAAISKTRISAYPYVFYPWTGGSRKIFEVVVVDLIKQPSKRPKPVKIWPKTAKNCQTNERMSMRVLIDRAMSQQPAIQKLLRKKTVKQNGKTVIF
jgi:hypothetical protein